MLGSFSTGLGPSKTFLTFSRATARVPTAGRSTHSVTAAEREGINALHGDVLDEQLWDDIDLTPFGSFLAATSNNELNSLACAKAAQAFEKDRVYQIRNSYKEERQIFTLDTIGGNQHYDLSLDIAGVSAELGNGKKRLEAVTPEDLGESSNIDETILLGIEEQNVLFSTRKEELASAEKVIRIMPGTVRDEG